MSFIGFWRQAVIPYFLQSRQVDNKGDLERVLTLLDSTQWRNRNKGVKEAGKLRLAPLVEQLCAMALDQREVGFVRRNALDSLVGIGQVTERVRQTLGRSLEDPYWEVRSHGAWAVAKLAENLPEDEELERALLINLDDTYFEVRMALLEALGAYGRSAEMLEAVYRCLEDNNWRVRDAALRTISSLLNRGVIAPGDDLKRNLDRVILTAEGFGVTFQLKADFAALMTRLGPL